MSKRHYILRDKQVVAIDDLHTWAQWMENNSRQVMHAFGKGYEISTVFLGIDHGFLNIPLFFETMVFEDGEIEDSMRYQTYEEAERGHIAMCRRYILKKRGKGKWAVSSSL